MSRGQVDRAPRPGPRGGLDFSLNVTKNIVHKRLASVLDTEYTALKRPEPALPLGGSQARGTPQKLCHMRLVQMAHQLIKDSFNFVSSHALGIDKQPWR